jgi:CxC6 like cysteine cluster associated with KDZ transposases
MSAAHCCAIHNCKIHLANNRHRFCAKHVSQNLVCAIIGCDSDVTPDHRTCSRPSHREAERIHRERGQARFQLKERLQRAQVAHPNDAIGEDVNTAELVDADEETGEFDVGSAQVDGTKEQVRAQFGRRRTHNEQIIVAPCGMIVARETFYGAEGVGSVIVSEVISGVVEWLTHSVAGNDQAHLP